MNFQQLRSIREAARRNYNLTEVANALFTSQPGVSRQIRELEDELGVVIFERNGKRLTGMTEPGKGILKIIDRLLIEAENLQQASLEYTDSKAARLTSPPPTPRRAMRCRRWCRVSAAPIPDVRIALQQSAPEHIAEWVLSGKTDIGIATEGLSQFPDLVSFPCYRWSHLIVVPDGHPLLSRSPIKLEDLAEFPLITYDVGFTGRGHIDAAFAQAGVKPDIVLTAMDSDVIKQYVRWAWASASSPRWRSTTAATRACARWRRRTCSHRTPRGWRCAAAPICARTPTTSSSNLRPI
jgi:LysR family cys regulon transcriptional activator